MLTTAWWAEVAVRIGVPDPDALYDALSPCSGQVAIAGNIIDCGGSVDRLLRALAERRGHLELAVSHAEAGLELEQRAGYPVWQERSALLLDRLRLQAV